MPLVVTLKNSCPASEMLVSDPTERKLRDLYAYPEDGHTVRVGLISSLDGAATGEDNTSSPLGSADDRRVFTVLRSLADVIVVGAATARTEDYGPPKITDVLRKERVKAGQEPTPKLVLLTKTGEVPSVLVDDPNTFFVSSPEARQKLIAQGTSPDHFLFSHDNITPHTVVDTLASAGMTNILCEGGPSVVGEWLSSTVVDEICLTTSGFAVSGIHPRIAHGEVSAEKFTPRSLLVSENGIFSRWVR